MVLEIVTSVVLLLVGIAVLVIIHLCIAGRTFGMTQESTGSGTLVRRSSTMSEDDIKKLPWYDYKLDQDDADANEEEDDNAAADDDDNGVKRVECAVCLEVFKVGDRCRLLPNCGHNFHANCIDLWLIKTAACPICRTCVNWGDVCLELT